MRLAGLSGVIMRKIGFVPFLVLLTSWGLVGLLAGNAGCGDGPESNEVCVPGSAAVCACPRETSGVHVCAMDGSKFGACVCPTLMSTGGSGGATPGAGGQSPAGASGGAHVDDTGMSGGITGRDDTGGGGPTGGLTTAATGGDGATGGDSTAGGAGTGDVSLAGGGQTAGGGAGGDGAQSMVTGLGGAAGGAAGATNLGGGAASGPASAGHAGDSGGADGHGATGGIVAPPPPPPPPPERLVTVQIIDAVIGPGKADGSAWDGFGSIPSALSKSLSQALVGVNPYAAVLALLADPASRSLAKPDAYGSAQATLHGVATSAMPLATRAQAISDNFTPIWPASWAFRNVPIDSDVRITVTLWDADLAIDDPIGAVVINAADLKAALAAQKKVEVKVDDQTSNQLLFVGITAVLQDGPVP